MHLVLEQVVKDTVPLDAEHHGPVWGGWLAVPGGPFLNGRENIKSVLLLLTP